MQNSTFMDMKEADFKTIKKTYLNSTFNRQSNFKVNFIPLVLLNFFILFLNFIIYCVQIRMSRNYNPKNIKAIKKILMSVNRTKKY